MRKKKGVQRISPWKWTAKEGAKEKKTKRVIFERNVRDFLS